jgi:hypothetical protein
MQTKSATQAPEEISGSEMQANFLSDCFSLRPLWFHLP